MSQERLPPPPPECLDRPYPSTQKGGTLIAEDVMDLATHEQRVAAPGGYRPDQCPGCEYVKVHVHEYRERHPLELPGVVVILVIRYRCPSCRAKWLILPAFLARRLWRTWKVVESATLGPPPPPSAPVVPKRTVRRWWSRLSASALLLAQLLATSGDNQLAATSAAVGLHGTREELVLAHAKASNTPAGQRLAVLATLVHRLAPGIRLA